MSSRLTFENLETRNLLTSLAILPIRLPDAKPRLLGAEHAEASAADDSYHLPGDIDGNGTVDFTDFVKLSIHFGSEDATREEGDLDGDGSVSMSDFSILSSHYGESVPVANDQAATSDVAKTLSTDVQRIIVRYLIANQLSELTRLSVQLKQRPGVEPETSPESVDAVFAEASTEPESPAHFRDALLQQLTEGEVEEQQLFDRLMTEHGWTMSFSEFRERVRPLIQTQVVLVRAIDFPNFEGGEQRYSLPASRSNT